MLLTGSHVISNNVTVDDLNDLLKSFKQFIGNLPEHIYSKTPYKSPTVQWSHAFNSLAKERNALRF